MRVVIGGPTRDTVPVSFALDLARLMVCTEHGPHIEALWLRYVLATYVHVGREAVAEAALACQATHVLWLDTDMVFAPDTALRLAQHQQPIVACNCVMRDPRLLFTAQRGGQRIESGPDATGLEPVDSVGLAVCLMETAVLANLPRPWFRHGETATGIDIGEDVMFCQALRAAGHTIHIDHDCSKTIGHIGQHIYRPTAAMAPLAV